VFEKHRVAADEVEDYLRLERLREDGPSEIARLQERREKLHETWALMENKKRFSGDQLRAYVEALSGVIRHRHRAARVTLTNHARLHRLLMAVLGRLVDYSSLWERDLYFVALALIHQGRCRPEDVLTDEGVKLLGNGRIVEALRDKSLKTTATAMSVLDGLKRHFGSDFHDGSKGKAKIRNDFAHFNMLKPANLPLDLTACVNDCRSLMAYDRKLRNAVSQSVKELLQREGLDLKWKMGDDHRLGAAELATRQAEHLGKARLTEKRGPKPPNHPIRENLHGDDFVAMVAALFGRGVVQSRKSVADLSLDTIDWTGNRNWSDNEKKRAGNHRNDRQGRGNCGYQRQ
jgi:hypothetical protein